MKFVHIADVHLGAVPDGSKPWSKERAQEIYDTFAEIIEVCNEKRADLLLIAGDLFHRQPLKRELKEVNALFARLNQTQVLLMAGNHDCLCDTSYYRDFPWNENVHFFYNKEPERIYFPLLDAEVWGLSYHTPKVPQRLYDGITLEQSETYKILLAHGGEDDCIPIRRDLLAEKGFDYIALGHFHTPVLRQREKLAYAGSLEPLSVAEMGQHGYILGEITPEGTTFELIPFCQREYKSLSFALNGEAMSQLTELIKQRMEELGSEHLYQLILTGKYDPKTPPDTQLLMKELKNVVQVVNKAQPDYNMLEIFHEHSGDLIGKYMETLHEMPANPLNGKALSYGVSALLPE